MQRSLLKTVGVVSLLLVSAGCTTSSRPLTPADEADRDAALNQLLSCLDRNVSRLDDGVSDATTISVALVDGPCAPETAAALETHSRNLSPLARRKFYDMATAQYELGLAVVLKHRARR